MNRNFPLKQLSAGTIAATAAACLCLAAQGQVVMTDIGPTAPTPGPDDIAQTSTNGDVQFPDGLNYYTDNGANNGRYAGQTFTTGSRSAGYTLTSVSINAAGIDSGGGYNNSQLFHLFIYSVSGGTATLLQSYTTTSQFIDGDWLQWTNLGIEVTANSTYAYGFGRDGSGSGWAGLGNATGNPYAGGELATIPPGGGSIVFGSSHGFDAAFEIGLSTSTSQLPPQISAQPVSQTVFTNAAATFSLSLAPSAVLPGYKWFKVSGGATNAIGGATSASLTLSHVQTADIAGYFVVVTNIYGASTSTVATLSLKALPASIAYKTAVTNDHPAGYWPLDLTVDTSGTAADLSGNGNYGSYSNISAGNQISGPSTYIPHGVNFDGTSAFVDLSPGPNTTVLNIGGQITMEAWVQPAISQHVGDANIIAKGYDASQNYDELEMRISGGFHAGTYNGTIGDRGVSGGPVTANWTHAVCTWDGNNWNLYLNGHLVGTGADTVGALQFTDPWAIGTGTASGNNRFFTGGICQTALYTNALSPVEVFIHFMAGEYGGAANLPSLISAQPAGETVYTNGIGTFSVASSGLTPAYQWYQVGGGVTNTIVGATNASYSTAPATPAMSGNGYLVTVYDTTLGLTATSSTAVLTVLAGSPDALSVQFQPYGDGAESTDLPLLAGESTGAFPATNWNPLLVNVRPTDATAPQNFVGLKDSKGIGSAIQLAVLGASDGWTANQPAPDNAPITKLLNSFVKAGYGPNWPNFPNALGSGLDVFVFSNLDNTQTYDIYVYLLANDDANFPDIDAGTGVTNYAGVELTYVDQHSSFIPSLNQDPSSMGSLNNRDQGNFVRLTGITPTSGTITITVNYDDPANNLYNPNDGSGVGVCGLQIVRSSVDTFPVTITREPADERAVTNTPATFSVSAVGVPLPAYQWYSIIGGVTNLIPNATNATYSTPPVQDSDTGNAYFVVVSNMLNHVTSTIAVLTAGHRVATTGYLEADEYFGNYSGAFGALTTLYPTASLPAPNRIEYLTSFNDNADLPDNAGERIYGWFTPPVSGNYIFFVASDDAAVLWLSTNNSPTNVYEVAQNQQWMVCGNDGPADWNLSNSGSGEYVFLSTGEWRSDGFETNNGPNALASVIMGWSPWPGVNSDGSIPLVAGTQYYIELDHFEGGGGQGATVTYKLAGAPDPGIGSATLLAGNRISAFIPDSLAPQPRPRIVNVSVSGPNVTLSGTNGLVNAVYNVLSSPSVTAPPGSWTSIGSGRFDSTGHFSFVTPKVPGAQRFYQLQVP